MHTALCKLETEPPLNPSSAGIMNSPHSRARREKQLLFKPPSFGSFSVTAGIVQRLLSHWHLSNSSPCSAAQWPNRLQPQEESVPGSKETNHTSGISSFLSPEAPKEPTKPLLTQLVSHLRVECLPVSSFT